MGYLFNNTLALGCLPFPTQPPSSPTLPSKRLALRSLAQGLLLGDPTLTPCWSTSQAVSSSLVPVSVCEMRAGFTALDLDSEGGCSPLVVGGQVPIIHVRVIRVPEVAGVVEAEPRGLLHQRYGGDL